MHEKVDFFTACVCGFIAEGENVLVSTACKAVLHLAPGWHVDSGAAERKRDLERENGDNNIRTSGSKLHQRNIY